MMSENPRYNRFKEMENKDPYMDLVPSPEAPSHLHEQLLHTLQIGGKRVRMSVHEDVIQEMLHMFAGGMNVDDLFLQGRVLTREAALELRIHPVYELYKSSREVRVDTIDSPELESHFVIPNTPGMTDIRVSRLLTTPHTPSSLAAEVGYDVGYFPVRDVLKYAYESEGVIGSLVQVFGGTNAIVLGSEYRSEKQLRRIGLELYESVRAKEPTSRYPSPDALLKRLGKTFRVLK